MSIRIEIPSELEGRLLDEAGRRGVAPADFVIGALNASLPSKTSLTPKELVASWAERGILGTFSDRSPSPLFAEELRHTAEQR